MINIDELKQLVELANMLKGDAAPAKSATPSLNTQDAGALVIVRCRDAGVHYGELIGYQGREVHLSKSRRMWYFKCKKGHTLSGAAIHGIKSESKIAGELENIILLDACEIIPCSDKAIKSIGGADEYQP